MVKRITIPLTGPGRRHVKAEIVEHVAAFVEVHRDHKVTQSKTTDWKKPWRIVCHTCGQHMTIRFGSERTH